MTACCPMTRTKVRRGVLSMIVGSALCAAAFVGADPVTRAEARAVDPAALLPAGTVMMLSIDGAPCRESAKDLALAKILREPEVQSFLKPAMDMLDEQVDAGAQQFAKKLGLTMEELEKLENLRLVLAVTKFEPPKGGMHGEPAIDLMLAMELRGNQKSIDVLLKLAESQMAAMAGGEEIVKDATVAGIPGRMMQVPPGGPFEGITYVFHDGWLLAASNVKDLEGAIARAKSGDAAGSLASNANYAAAAKEVVKPKTIMSFYMDYGVMIDLMAATGPPEMRKMLTSMGLDSIKSMLYAMDLDGASIRDRFFGGMTPNSPLMKLAVPLDTSGILARVPKRSIAAYAMSLNLRGYYDYTMKAVAELAEMGGAGDLAEFEGAMKEVDALLGPTWRDDLLPNLGPEMAVFASMPQYGLIPDVGWLIKVGDRAKVEAALTRVFDQPKMKAAHRSFSFGDATVNYLDLGTLELDRNMNLRPAYAFVDGHMLMTLCPVSAKNLILGMAQKDGGLLAREDFSKTFGRLKAENPAAGNAGVGYVDAPWLVGFALENMIPIVQCGMPPDELEHLPVKIDVGAIPTAHAIVKHLSGIVMQATIKENGTYTEIVSPTGIVPLFGGIGGLGAVVGMRRMRAAEVIVEPEPMPEPVEEPKDEDK